MTIFLDIFFVFFFSLKPTHSSVGGAINIYNEVMTGRWIVRDSRWGDSLLFGNDDDAAAWKRPQRDADQKLSRETAVIWNIRVHSGLP